MSYKYCTEYLELPEHIINGEPMGKVFDTCIQEGENGWHLELPSGADIGIKFCPYCGRNLAAGANAVIDTIKVSKFLPVDVGDKVWYIKGAYYNSQCLEPREIEVTEINKKKSGKIIDWAFIAHGTRYKFSSIGKTVFLTKEACVQEIEKRKLKRQQ